MFKLLRNCFIILVLVVAWLLFAPIHLVNEARVPSPDGSRICHAAEVRSIDKFGRLERFIEVTVREAASDTPLMRQRIYRLDDTSAVPDFAAMPAETIRWKGNGAVTIATWGGFPVTVAVE